MHKTIDFAGIKVDNITLKEALTKVEEFMSSNRPHFIATPNPEIIVTAQEDEELKNIINNADLRIPDGISMLVVSRILQTPLKERVSGIELMLKLVEFCSVTHKKIFLLGSKPGVAEEAAANLVKIFPGVQIVGSRDGYFKNDMEIVNQIKAAKPDILFIGLGAGRQEKWLIRHLKTLNIPVSMVIGGSLDIISGRKKRAPKWIQKLYIEWLYRLITEPNRWKRQLALPKFLGLTLFRRVL